MKTIPITKGFNKYKIDGNITVLYLCRRNGEIFETFIDTDDLSKLIKHNNSWHVWWNKDTQSYYCRCTEHYFDNNGKYKGKTVYLHKFIMDSIKGEVIDHYNHNTLYNCKENLKRVDMHKNDLNRKSKNSNNKSGYRNVFWDSTRGKWKVTLCKNYKTIDLGFFIDVHEAGKIAEKAREKYYGEFQGLS